MELLWNSLEYSKGGAIYLESISFPAFIKFEKYMREEGGVWWVLTFGTLRYSKNKHSTNT